MIRFITGLKIQGFKLNSTNYGIFGFTLEFSLDGYSWYQYIDDDDDDIVPKVK